MAEQAGQSRIGDGDRLGPRVPRHRLTLPCRRPGLVVTVTDDEVVAKIEMGVATGARVDVDVRQARTEADALPVGVPARGEGETQPRLLLRLPPGGVPRGLPRFEMPPGLHPDVQSAVLEEEHAAPPGDEAGSRDVHRSGVTVERRIETAERIEAHADRGSFPIVDRSARRHGLDDDGA